MPAKKFQVGDLTLVMVNKINIRSLEEIDISVDAKVQLQTRTKITFKRCVRQGKYVGIHYRYLQRNVFYPAQYWCECSCTFL